MAVFRYKASRPSEAHKTEKKATSSTSIKRTTANSNNIVVTHISAPTTKVKPKSKHVEASMDNAPVVEMQDEDDSHEEEAALASPLKGSESRKMNKVF